MDKELKERTSKRIKELRLKSDYTMETLAAKLGVSKSTIAKWENGYVDNLRQDNIMKLAEVFSVSPIYIMGYDAPEPTREEKFSELYSRLDEDRQILVDNMIKALISKQ